MNNVLDIIREMESNYTHGKTVISKYVNHSMFETIETIDAYLNSKHISGEKDSLGRPKPFFNIVSAVANVYYRATDLDRKNIRILPDKDSNVTAAFFATMLLRDWMNKARFGMFLNEWGRALSKYGSAVVKFVEKEGDLNATVIPWNRLIVDPIDFNSSPVIEKFYKTPAQLRGIKEYDQKVVKELLDSVGSRETQDGQRKDNRANFIEIYEIHGELDESYLSDDPLAEETGKFVQQMHVVSYVTTKDGKYKDYTLFKGKEKRSPYMITHLIPEDGRTLSIGPVELLFEAQWMVNHTAKNMKDTLDLASKLIFQTADTNYVGRNVINAIESGDIFIHKDGNNMRLERVANDKPDITALQNFGTQWLNLSRDITSTPEALRGETLPSGTPYSLGAYLGGQASSLFSLMTENKGLFLEDMLREFVIPFLKKKMDTKDEIVAILDENDITEIDSRFIPKQAIRQYNNNAKEDILNGAIPSPFDKAAAEQGIKQGLAQMGNKRIFKPDEIGEKTWKDALSDLEMKVIVEITGESTDKQAVLQTLSTVLQSIASNPAILQDPNARLVFNAILKETSVISPIQLSTSAATPPVVGGLSTLPNNPIPNGGTNKITTPAQSTGGL